jgi:signal transduction histidine kinase
LPDLINYLGQFALEFLRTADVPCHMDLPDHPPRRAVSAEARHNLFLAVKEALNNIVRHAGPCEVRLKIAPDRDALRITISDNGRGFSGSPNDGCADGLRNMRQRLADIGGTCELETVPGQGTTLAFVYPWPEGSLDRIATGTNGVARPK